MRITLLNRSAFDKQHRDKIRVSRIKMLF